MIRGEAGWGIYSGRLSHASGANVADEAGGHGGRCMHGVDGRTGGRADGR